MMMQKEIVLTKITPEIMLRAKSLGYSDVQLAYLLKSTQAGIRQLRHELNVFPAYKSVDTCAAEFEATTPYYYSTYETHNEAIISKKKKIIILGGGPNRIGQGIEFDYCCVKATQAFKKIGYETIMINCNPETVSTDYDISDKLYFEPLSFEDVMGIIDAEKPYGVVISFGGQTPLKLSVELEKAGVNILGTSSKDIDVAEDRKKFGEVLKKLQIPHPKYGIAYTQTDALSVAKEIGYPVLVRPSYVLGGRAMKIIYNDAGMKNYVATALHVSEEKPLLIDSFLEQAGEFDVDAVSDGNSCVVIGIMRHIEGAGIHSGDSTTVLPPIDTPKPILKQIKKFTKKIAKSLNVIGLMNIQFAVQKDKIYVLEVNPRASRTVPFVCKAIGIEMIEIACHLMLGKKIPALTKQYSNLKDCDELNLKHICVKEPVFPFSRFDHSGVFLGPEMKSTGEVMSFAEDINFGEAFFKAALASGNKLPNSGSILASLNDSDKYIQEDKTKSNMETVKMFKAFFDLGFDLIATSGTAQFLRKNGIECKTVFKSGEGRPNVADIIQRGRVQFVINTPMGEKARFDEMTIGAAVIQSKVSYVTTIEAAKAALVGITQNRKKSFDQALQMEESEILTPNVQLNDTLHWNKSLNKLSLLQTLTAKVTVSFKNPYMNHTVNGHLTVKKNNFLFLSLAAFLGIKVFDAYFAKDSMWVHNVFEGRLFIGETTPENINKMVKIPLPFFFFTTTALGIPTWNTAPKETTKTQTGFQYTWQSNHSKIASKDDKNFIQAYSEVMLIQVKEEIAKTKNKIFNKQDTLKSILKKYNLTTETYKNKLKEYTEDIKDWMRIQDSATAYLKRQLK
ncbi:hypothetical protein CHS0354_000454 [Potamilus streckersoni]|uniref:Carbamoyl-phosphate synthase (glutamine-hydrolyzing) n=1 Tax=Potamilus streckersoni TaxID=2493646 RepID=A0AAE0T6Z4_9BIVA|nr:hypothetical protein CHS0354_000454 [Potamilus streckersoni]